MKLVASRAIPLLILGGIIFLYILAGLAHIRDPFIDGRYHQNWNPPFWLINAEVTNRVGMTQSFFGVATSYEEAPDGTSRATSFYSSHPQLIGPLFALWTKVFGYAEWSPRLLSLLVVSGAMLLWALSLREIYGWQLAISSTALLASVPLMVVYGTMLNHEPLVFFFLSLALWGIVRVIRKRSGGLIIFSAGALGLGLADWSGFVFGILLGALFLLPPLRRAERAKILALAALGATAVAAILFLVQSYLQAGSPPLDAFIQRYLDLWRYRSGQETAISWWIWLRKEFIFLNNIYSLPLFAAGMAGLGTALFSLRASRSSVEKQIVPLFAAAVLAGQLFYLVALKQATFIHVYYQYFFALPIALGTIWLIQRLSARSRSEQTRQRLFAAGVIVVIAASAVWSWRVYTHLLTQEMWGDRSDIELVASLKTLPMAARIAAIDNEKTLAWFANPNIQYYAHRGIERYTLDHVPLTPYQIVPVHMADGLIKLLASGQAFGAPVITEKISCSTHFCLLHLEP